MNFWNMVANKGLTLITNILFNAILSDMETCYKCFRREVVENMHIKARGFEFEPEFTAKVLRQGIRIVEVPISYYGREYEEGKKIKVDRRAYRSLDPFQIPLHKLIDEFHYAGYARHAPAPRKLKPLTCDFIAADVSSSRILFGFVVKPRSWHKLLKCR